MPATLAGGSRSWTIVTHQNTAWMEFRHRKIVGSRPKRSLISLLLPRLRRGTARKVPGGERGTVSACFSNHAESAFKHSGD
jgi:hypothetical protein